MSSGLPRYFGAIDIDDWFSPLDFRAVSDFDAGELIVIGRARGPSFRDLHQFRTRVVVETDHIDGFGQVTAELVRLLVGLAGTLLAGSEDDGAAFVGSVLVASVVMSFIDKLRLIGFALLVAHAWVADNFVSVEHETTV